MNFSIDAAYKSLNKIKEELCGDKVELLKTVDSDIMILADGMGSGVKANILATLTSKILGTMFLNGASIDDCIETIAKTLPVCQVRQIAYSTFSILQVSHDGQVYLAEFDNPSCIVIRKGKIFSLPFTERVLENKVIRECRFQAEQNDCFILMSDGVIHAGVGNLLNFGWSWQNVAEYALSAAKETLSASRLANTLIKACDDLYMQLPGDDTTVAILRITQARSIDLFTGPPYNPEDDTRLIHDFIHSQGKKIICGGTSANIASRILKRPLVTSLNYTDPSLPPIAKMEGIDLVTEGVLTLSRALDLIKQYKDGPVDEQFFEELDKDNGGSRVAKYIIEDCSILCLFVGKAMNEAHQNPSLPFNLSIRLHLVDQLKEAVTAIGKEVHIQYY
ncbi:SpoIIE family protein phosphatase [Anaerocolumna xylanovorans]|uniref:Stage II sporulation protein E (SpoIIE) n=1 Tax=Anaerocolumna xylanovorans DSM 12503 TaxID=1121345 RepID=A0A1M7YJX1_9FIRM|nr:SpoIIE family protein phosphatase [Anaerocolumna xylanovorans]SHO52876.1 Stage II sporulation protein E (SpoIIE) [Anaerocolumna xylanovorans DSM 12503]